MNKAFIIGVGFVGFLYSAVGMTASELQSLIDAADPGATVEVTSDIHLSSKLTIGKSLTLKSFGETVYVISRDFNNEMIDITSSDAEVRLESIVFDGYRDVGRKYGRFVTMNQGKLIFGEGATICDFTLNKDSSTSSGTIYLGGSAVLEMEDGATIRDLQSQNYAHGVLVNGAARFDMKGGVITECVGLRVGAACDYDGAVYVMGGTFNMSGGSIVGNYSSNCCAGICVYSGSVAFSGNATVTNNHGGTVNDLYIRPNNPTPSTIKDGYSGVFTFYTANEPSASKSADSGKVLALGKESASKVAGLGRLVNQKFPEWGFNGFYDETGTIYWDKPRCRVDGVAVCSMDEAFSLAGSGSTVELLDDLVLSSTLTIPKSLTLKSAPNRSCSVTRAGNFTMFALGASDAEVRLESITFDGCKATGRYGRFVELASGKLIFGNGTTICNFMLHKDSPARYGTISLGGAATLVMEEGSVLYGMEAASYGHGVLVNTGASFEMRGGLITKCSGNYSGNDWNMNGVVYVEGGSFNMSGGCICSNVANTACAGVCGDRGTVQLSGSASIFDNTNTLATCADLCLGLAGATFSGDFRGKIGISSGSQSEGEVVEKVTAEDGASGAWSFFAAGSGKSNGLIARMDEDNLSQIRWAEPSGEVAGIVIASAEDASRAMPKRLNVTADWLPITFAGSALAANGTVDVNFEPDELIAAGKVPLTVFSGVDGEFSGDISFVLPEATRDRWAIRKRGRSYVLRNKQGLALTVR